MNGNLPFLELCPNCTFCKCLHRLVRSMVKVQLLQSSLGKLHHRSGTTQSHPTGFFNYFCSLFTIFSIYLAPSGAKYYGKGWGRFKKGGKPILGLFGFLRFREISSRDQVGC